MSKSASLRSRSFRQRVAVQSPSSSAALEDDSLQSIVAVEFKDTATWDAFRSVKGFLKAASSPTLGWMELRLKNGSRERVTFGGASRENHQRFVETYDMLRERVGKTDST